MAVSDNNDSTVEYKETDQNQIYKQNVLEHYKNPRNSGKLSNPTIVAKGVNRVCGDTIEVYALIENNILKDIKFEAFGCSICIASASMMSDHLKNKHIEDIKKITKDKILKVIGIPILSASRLKCATLLIDTIKQGLKTLN